MDRSELEWGNNSDQMSTNSEFKTTLDDLVALLLQGQSPFGDAEFIEAARVYRTQMRGAMARQQVNLAACLYLQVNSDRPTEPRIRELGGWGQRNDVLADIAAFNRGSRPSSSTALGAAALSLSAPGVNVLHIAMTQGLEAAQKQLEADVRKEFEVRIEEIQRLADQRVQAAEQNALGATELKEAAQAESRLLETKFDQAIIGRTELSNRAAAAEARADALSTQVESLTGTLSLANDRLATAEQLARALQAQLDDLHARRESERREHMLAMDKARHGQDQMLGNQQAEIARLGSLLEKSQEAAEANGLAARRAESLVASSQAELSAASAKIADLEEQLAALVAQAGRTVELGALIANLGTSLEGIRGTVASLQEQAARASDIANVMTAIEGVAAEIKKIESQSQKPN